MDYFGSLRDRPGLRKLAAYLTGAGVPVHVISAVAVTDAGADAYAREIASWGIAFAAVHFVRFADVPDYEVGLLKVAKMREIGATALWDDNPGIVRAVRDSGLFCWHLGAD